MSRGKHHVTAHARDSNRLWQVILLIRSCTFSGRLEIEPSSGEEPILIHKPGNYEPADWWEVSREAYDVAALLSFHFLEMKLFTEDGALVETNPIRTRADHIVELPLDLKPGSELRIPIPLDEFYDLDSGLNYYALELTYGDNNLTVSARSHFQYP